MSHEVGDAGDGRSPNVTWHSGALTREARWQALGAATWRGGELLGEPDAGRIREDGPADFFLVSGNPYNDPGALWNVRRLA